jgi:hypothetical protein
MTMKRNAIAKAYIAGKISAEEMLEAVQNPAAIERLTLRVTEHTEPRAILAAVWLGQRIEVGHAE